MNEKVCMVCQDFPVFHKIQIVEEGRETIQYLCSEHFQEIEDPRKFFSLLQTDTDIRIPSEEVLYTEFFSD